MIVQSLVPVLFVDSIEPCLPFWERLGFERSTEVADEGGELGFVGLKWGQVEIMYQSRASLAKDLPQLAEDPTGSFLYCAVEDLDELAAKLEPSEVVVPRRQTLYGADEIGAREPGGNVVLFARF